MTEVAERTADLNWITDKGVRVNLQTLSIEARAIFDGFAACRQPGNTEPGQKSRDELVAMLRDQATRAAGIADMLEGREPPSKPLRYLRTPWTDGHPTQPDTYLTDMSPDERWVRAHMEAWRIVTGNCDGQFRGEEMAEYADYATRWPNPPKVSQ